MGWFEIRQLPLPGAAEVTSAKQADARGSFMRLFCAGELAEVIGTRSIVNVNHSVTRTRGAVRGLHYQRPPYGEMKLVRCLQGRVFDVAVDLRPGNTFLQWTAVDLTPERRNMMVVPEGFAHGFQVIEEPAEICYLTTAHYNADAEGGLHPADPRLAIAWPLAISQLSDRDRAHPFIDDRFAGLDLRAGG